MISFEQHSKTCSDNSRKFLKTQRTQEVKSFEWGQNTKRLQISKCLTNPDVVTTKQVTRFFSISENQGEEALTVGGLSDEKPHLNCTQL